MRHFLGAMHSLAMSECVLAELMNMFGGKTFALCLHNLLCIYFALLSGLFHVF